MDGSATPVLVSAGADGTIRKWNPLTGDQVAEPSRVRTGPLFSVCGINVGGVSTLASAGGDGSVRLWQQLDHEEAIETVLPGHVGGINALLPAMLGPGGQSSVITGGDDGTLRIWNCEGQQSRGDPISSSCIVQVVGGRDQAASEIYALSATGRILHWNPDLAVATQLMNTTVGSALLALSDLSGRSLILLVTGTGEAIVHRSDDSFEQSLGAIADGPIVSMAMLSTDPLTVAVGHPSGILAVWRWKSWSAHGSVLETQAHHGPVSGLSVFRPSEDLTLLVSAGSDGIIKLWDPHDLRTVGRSMKGHEGRIWTVLTVGATDESDDFLATAGADGAVCLWRFEGQGLVLAHRLLGHAGGVHALSVVQDGRRARWLLSGGHDGTLRLWSVASSKIVTTVPLGDPIHALRCTNPAGGVKGVTDGGIEVTVGTSSGILTLVVSTDLQS
jgi:WD40 repeat protein